MIEWSKANPRRCPKCGEEDSMVTNTRVIMFDIVARWRKCKLCDTIWKTLEVNASILEGK